MVSQGVGNIDLGARYPLYQFVSANGLFDNTLGVATEAGIPTSSSISVNAEFDPKIFDDLRLGKDFSLQSVFGYLTLFGGGESGGLQTFEYAFAFGYMIPHSKMPLAYVQKLTPMFELEGERGSNKDESGQNSLLGSIGFRLDLKPMGDVQSSVGLGYVFPLDSNVSAEVQSGIRRQSDV